MPAADEKKDMVQLPVKSGAIRLSAETGVPIVVVGGWGAQDTWRKGKLPRPRFRQPHALVVLPGYVVEAGQGIDEAREILADKMRQATQQAKNKLGDK